MELKEIAQAYNSNVVSARNPFNGIESSKTMSVRCNTTAGNPFNGIERPGLLVQS
jgi:hypothetical protein